MRKPYLLISAISLVAMQMDIPAAPGNNWTSAAYSQTQDQKAESSDSDTTATENLPVTTAKIPKAERLDDLFAQLARQANAAPAGLTARKIWAEWTDSGSATINALMTWAATAMNNKKHAEAQDFLDQVIVLKPDFSEGWNRRATLFFAMKQYGKSIADIEQTLKLEPRHFGALAGLGMILQQSSQEEKALETWYKVLEIYPANKQAQEAVIALEEKLMDRRT